MPIHKVDASAMYVVVIIPCYNEADSIRTIIYEINSNLKNYDFCIMLIDDGSTDETADIARSCGVDVVSHSFNMGVGTAFQTGIKEAINRKADIAINMDGDGQFFAEDIPKLIQPILENRADFVTASRFIDASLTPTMPWIKYWGNKRMARLISFLTNQKFHDVSCGFRAYSREALLQLNLIGKFTYTQETFLDLAFKGLKIKEVPIKVQGQRQYGQSRVANNLWKYAINTFKIIFRTYRDYKPLRFFGGMASVLLSFAFGLGSFFFWHYFNTGQFSGHLWAGFSSGFLLLFSLLLFITGLLADMFDRIRQNQEKLLYFEKLKLYNQDNNT